VFKRYKDQWEIIIRDTSDIVPCTDEIAPPVVIPPSGDGSQANPYNVAAALAKCTEVGKTATTEDYYAVGYVTSIKSIGGQYKNAEFTISDTKDGDNELTVYRAKGPDNSDITDANLIKVGDKVVICGKLVNFGGNTPEFTQGCYIVSINKDNGNDNTNGNDVGSQEAPKTVADALAAINVLEDGATTTEFYYVKGKVKQVITTDANITQFKNIDYLITDDGNNELKVFRGKYIDGADFTVENKVAVDKEVIVYGNLMKYVKNGVTTPEITNSKLISIQ
jgi:hypothetical protein